MIDLRKIFQHGGRGSGNFGHKGRIGQVGGSEPGGGLGSLQHDDPRADRWVPKDEPIDKVSIVKKEGQPKVLNPILRRGRKF